MLKRAVDMILAGIGLILLAPVFVVIAIWIRMDSSGPVFFRQERVGLRGKLFRIHKFRTMSDGASFAGPGITIGDDPRITRAGRFLRRWKLDELPQLIDVCRGAMSLVGPRPELSEYVSRYPLDARNLILSVRPGITDPTSVRYVDESTTLACSIDPEAAYVDVILPQKIDSYCRYVRNRTFLTDMAILFGTIRAIIVRREV